MIMVEMTMMKMLCVRQLLCWFFKFYRKLDPLNCNKYRDSNSDDIYKLNENCDNDCGDNNITNMCS